MGNTLGQNIPHEHQKEEEQKVEELKNNCTSLVNECEWISDTITKIKIHKSTQETRLQEKDQIQHEKCQRYEIETNELQDEINELGLENQRLTQKYYSACTANEIRKSELNIKKVQLTNLKREQGEMVKAYENLQEKHTNYEIELKNELGEMVQAYEDLQKTHDHYETEIKSLKNENSSLSETVHELNESIEIIKEENIELHLVETAYENVQQQVNILENEKNSLSETLHELNTSFENIKEENNKLQLAITANENLNKQNEILENENTSIRETVRILNVKFKNIQDDQYEQQFKFDEQLREATEDKFIVDCKKEMIENLRYEKSELTKEYNDIVNDNEMKNEELSNLKNSLNITKDELQNKKDIYIILQHNMRKLTQHQKKNINKKIRSYILRNIRVMTSKDFKNQCIQELMNDTLMPNVLEHSMYESIYNKIITEVRIQMIDE
tara:strand:- start:691 stop:2022 length:1332 start_codon:yes stop_codon:yes gene_type:complete